MLFRSVVFAELQRRDLSVVALRADELWRYLRVDILRSDDVLHDELRHDRVRLHMRQRHAVRLDGLRGHVLDHRMRLHNVRNHRTVVPAQAATKGKTMIIIRLVSLMLVTGFGILASTVNNLDARAVQAADFMVMHARHSAQCHQAFFLGTLGLELNAARTLASGVLTETCGDTCCVTNCTGTMCGSTCGDTNCAATNCSETNCGSTNCPVTCGFTNCGDTSCMNTCGETECGETLCTDTCQVTVCGDTCTGETCAQTNCPSTCLQTCQQTQ